MRPRNQRALRSEAGFTLIDILFVVGLIGVLCGIALPTLLRTRSAANEASAIGSLRATNTAQLAYAITCGAGLYAPDFPTLGIPGGLAATGFLSPDLTQSATPLKNHYNYTMAMGAAGNPGGPDCNGTITVTDYYVTAVPDQVGQTGTRGFATNSEGTIFQDNTGVAPTEPFTIGGSVAPIQ